MDNLMLILLTSVVIYSFTTLLGGVMSFNFEVFGVQSLVVFLISGFLFISNVVKTPESELMLIKNNIAAVTQIKLMDFKEKTEENIDYIIAENIDNNFIGKDFNDLDIDFEKEGDELNVSYKLKLKNGIFTSTQIEESFIVKYKEPKEEPIEEETEKDKEEEFKENGKVE